MKIVTASKFYYQRAGLESYLFKLTDILRFFDHEVIPFSTRHKNNVKSDFEKLFPAYLDISSGNNLNIYKKFVAFSNIIYNVEAKRKFSRFLKKTKPDIVMGFGIHRHLSPSIFIEAKRHSIPVIHRLSDYAIICPASTLLRGDYSNCEELLCPRRGFMNAITHNCVKLSPNENNERKSSILASTVGAMELYIHNKLGSYVNNVDRFIAPSKFLRTTMVKAGIPKSKITYIPTFINAEEYKPEYESQAYFVYFGRLSHEKGLSILLDAMTNLKMHKLLIIGDGPQRENLEKTIIQKNLINVKLLGKMQGEQLKRVVRNARFVVVPSIWYDNSPNVILEAFALGKPVLGANIGGIPEYIAESTDGMLYQHDSSSELESKIDFLMNQPDFCQDLGKAGRKKILTKYNPVLHYDLLMKTINEVL